MGGPLKGAALAILCTFSLYINPSSLTFSKITGTTRGYAIEEVYILHPKNLHKQVDCDR